MVATISAMELWNNPTTLQKFFLTKQAQEQFSSLVNKYGLEEVTDALDLAFDSVEDLAESLHDDSEMELAHYLHLYDYDSEEPIDIETIREYVRKDRPEDAEEILDECDFTEVYSMEDLGNVIEQWEINKENMDDCEDDDYEECK